MESGSLIRSSLLLLDGNEDTTASSPPATLHPHQASFTPAHPNGEETESTVILLDDEEAEAESENPSQASSIPAHPHQASSTPAHPNGEETESTVILLDDEEDEAESESPSAPGQSQKPRGARRNFDFRTKLLAIECYEKCSNVSETSRRFGIKRAVLHGWLKRKEDIRALCSNPQESVRKRRKLPMQNKMAKASWPGVELELVAWVHDRRSKNLGVTGCMLKSKAKDLHASLPWVPCEDQKTKPSFTASNGWISNFFKRHNLVFRAPTSIGQKVPNNAAELAVSFFSYIQRHSSELPLCAIGNMDEMPCYFDMPSSKTVDRRGVDSVRIATTGYEKLRFTIVLTCFASGTKLPPLIIFKKLVKPPKGLFPGVYVLASKGGTMTTALMNKYRTMVWNKRDIFNRPALLCMDSAPAHKAAETLAVFKRHSNTTCAIIPGGMTPLLQPLDVCLNHVVKSNLRKRWNEFITESIESGQKKRATYEQVAEWTREAWSEIPTENIKASFRKCGIVGDQSGDLHSKLKSILREGGQLPGPSEAEEPANEEEEEEEATGLTDEEEVEGEEVPGEVYLDL